MTDIDIQKYIEGGKNRNCLHRSTRNGEWIRTITHHLNNMELYQEELRDNLCLRCGLMPQDIPATCNCSGEKFLMNNSLSCPKVGLVMARNDGAAKEWDILGD